MTTDCAETSTRQLPTRRRRGLAVLAAALGLALVLPAAPAAAAPVDAWASASGGNGNTRYDPGELTITAANAGKVTRAWTSDWANQGGEQGPAVAGGVAYYIHRSFNSAIDPTTLVAASARTGQRLWQVTLAPGATDRLFEDGVTVAGNRVLISFMQPRGFGAGLVAVDTRTRSIAWTRTVTGVAQSYAWSGHRVYADGTRAYLHLSDHTLDAFRLTDGAPQWSVQLDSVQGIGVALGAGVLYVGYHVGNPGITAFDAATGRRLWRTEQGYGTPVVAGGRVFATWGNSVLAYPAAGCGRATCTPLWTKTFPSGTDVTLGAADGSTLFVTYRKPAPAGSVDLYSGVVARLSATTGAQQWTVSAGDYFTPTVRGGNVVWVINEYRTAAGTIAYRILALPATGTSTRAVANIAVAQRGFPQALAIAGGTLFHKTHIPSAVTGYRVPGT